MRLHRLKRIKHLSVSIEKAWQFFSNPINLAEITPPWLSFKLTRKVQDNIYDGMIISYRLKPLLNIPVTWISEITHVKKPHFFVDEQRFGPYKFWHHQHLFKEVGNGTEMIDIVHYSLDYGMLGELVHSLIVSSRLNKIFDYRHEKLTQIFREIASVRNANNIDGSRQDNALGSGN